jgi:hypothetical protein
MRRRIPAGARWRAVSCVCGPLHLEACDAGKRCAALRKRRTRWCCCGCRRSSSRCLRAILCVLGRLRTYIYIYIHIHRHTHTQTDTHTQTHTHTDTHRHTHTNTQTHTHTPVDQDRVERRNGRQHGSNRTFDLCLDLEHRGQLVVRFEGPGRPPPPSVCV